MSSRRGFLGLAGAVSAPVLLGACGGGGSASGKGGSVRAAFPGFGAKETMDPHVGRQFVDQARHKAVFDKLVELDSGLRPVPGLVRRWEASDDLTVWRLRLRKARFHDGHRLEPEDVLFTLARILDPKSAERLAKSSLSLIDLKRSRALGEHGVELRLKRPHAELPSLLAFTGTFVVSRRYRDPQKPVGTGPFTFGSFSPGRHFTGKRFDDYWGGPAHIDELHILSAETEARSNAVRAGEIEYAHEMSPAFARTVRGESAVRIVDAPACGVEGVLLKTDRPPFDDPDAAMALKLLADRPRLVEVVLGGRGSVGNDMYGKGFAYYPDGVPQRERDVAEAKRLLRRSGVLNKKLTFYTSTATDTFVDAAHLFSRQAAEAGLRIDVTTGPPESYFTDILRTGTITSHRSGAMPIPTYISERLLSDSPQNGTRWRHKDFDADFRDAQSIKDADRRARRYTAVQRTLRDKGGLLLWGHPDWLNAVSRRLHGVRAAPPNTRDWARFDTVRLA
ncbi:peptide/nickel transport system substrate-binding protein [Streptomyces sp. Amel2xB2]|uniref:ABC transporter substrate-binding protein n=1 Tax=Streptomyces sp. Amel2xB2 TaxID=1305829 RepID=UPI000DBAA8C4|nr:ABC transporter substrate-binding protein [Streptomyces sp. Amel2xB2]RAJ56593.1 peptide/nickel transport system substrate-binding protein [Streptomyces sp. Amel2xB2]